MTTGPTSKPSMENLLPTPSADDIRVVVVDDSPAMRLLIKKTLAASTGFDVVGEAGDPYEARALIKKLSPDVVTLDIEMPRMNGLEFLEKIMRLRPMPVIMISSLTEQGATASIEALSLGAIDCVGKPSAANPYSLRALPSKIRAAARASVLQSAKAPPVALIAQGADYQRMIAIGASTGGVDALMKVLGRFPPDCPPTVVVQHMPREFTKTFARRLNQHAVIAVKEAEDGLKLERGCAYLAPGSDTHLEISPGTPMRCRLIERPLISGHRPSVDALFHSLARHAPNVVGAVLTGMGKDGAEGLKALRDAGCPTLVQDEASSVVFGMPRAALANGGAQEAVALDRMADALLAKACQKEGNT